MGAGMNFSVIRQRIEEKLLPRYQQLEAREQHIVLAAAILLPLMFMVFGILLPLQDRQQALRVELAQVQAQATEAEALARYLKQHAAEQKGAGTVAENLLTLVERMARQTQVRSFMTRIKPNNSPDGHEQLMVYMKNAPYDATLRFIHALAGRHLGLKMLKLQAADAPGHVHVRAVITGA